MSHAIEHHDEHALDPLTSKVGTISGVVPKSWCRIDAGLSDRCREDTR